MKIDLKKKLIVLAVPIFIETLLVMLLGFMDVLMLGKVSDASVAAVGFANQLLMLTVLIFMVSSAGTTVVCSQYVGAKQDKNFHQTVLASMVFSFSLGAFFSLFIYFYAAEILRFLDIREEIFPMAHIYLKTVGAFSFIPCIYNSMAAILRSCNLVRYPMYISLGVNLFNILGNYVLIFGKFGFPELGIEGAALSTVFSRSFALVFILFFMFKYTVKIPLRTLIHPFPFDKLKNIFIIGLPTSGEMVSYSLSQLVIVYFINQISMDALAARTIIVNTVIFTFVFGLGLSQASSIIVGQLVGQHKYHSAMIMGNYAIGLSITISLLLSMLLALLAPYFIPIMTQNPAIIALCVNILWIDILLEFGRAINIQTNKILSAAGSPNFCFIVGVIFMWSVATLGAYVFGIYLGYGLIGIWIAFILDENIRGLIQWRYWKSEKWANKSFT